jgi:two-component system, NarL family, nitrate/nitrite response regulator NarL
VVVVAESTLLRAGLLAMVSHLPGVSVVAADTLDAATDAELALWDLGDGPLSESARELLSTTPCLVFVESSARAYELVAAGARGVLFRDVDEERLGRAVTAALAGLTVLDEGMGPALLERKAGQGAGVPLTPREAEVLGLMAEGLSNKLIAARLGISDHTAKFHVNAVLEKLGAETRTEAVVRAARQGLLML